MGTIRWTTIGGTHMSPQVGYTKALATLARHGIDAETDADTIEAAIEARGWRVELERVDSGYRGGRPRFRALAAQGHDPLRSLAGSVSRSTTGPSARHVRILVLAKVLEHEDRTSSA